MLSKKAVTEQILSLLSIVETSGRSIRSSYFTEADVVLTSNLNRASSASSGSWTGYHANVYYEGFASSLPGDSFSPEWGLTRSGEYGGVERWQERDYKEVEAVVMHDVDVDYEDKLVEVSGAAESAFHDAFDRLSTLIAVLIENKQSAMLERIEEEASKIQGPVTKADIVEYYRPKGQLMTRDSQAHSQGTRIPPHIQIEARFLSLRSPFDGLADVLRIGRKLHRYMSMKDLIEVDSSTMGSKIFLGHGQSLVWRELQAFIQNRLRLPWDEFNREPVAGLATKERLQMMMDDACFAFLILTAEDEHADNSLHARENVVHEVGLFQGKLGFRRAIVLLEEDCSEFSNLSGLTQIRFPSGDISAVFEDVRRVLERERVLETS